MALSAYVNGSGTTLTLSLGKTVDAPLVTGIGTYPTIKVNGGAPVTPTDVFWCNPTWDDTGAACATFILPTVVAPGATVTFSAPAGCLTTAGGPSAAVTDAPVANHAGSSVLPQTPPDGRTLGVGWNVNLGEDYTPLVLYADWMKVTHQEWGSGVWPSVSAEGPFHEATDMPKLPANDWRKSIAGTVQPAYLASGYPLVPAGKWVLRYKNLREAFLSANGAYIYPDDPAQRFTKDGWSYKVYPNVPNTPGLCTPSMGVMIDTLGNADARIELYDKYVEDPTNPPLFHPKVLEMLAGSACHRMNTHINEGSPCCDLDDWMPETSNGYNYGDREAGRVGIVRFDPYDSAQAAGGLPYARPNPYDGSPVYNIKVTTAAPHNLKPGVFVRMYVPTAANPIKTYYTMPMADGSSMPIALDGLMCYPLDATSFVVTNQGLAKSIATNTPPAGTTLVRKRVACIPPKHQFDLANAVEGMGVHLSIPHGSTDTASDQLADLAIATLQSGKKLWLEYTNEPWNYLGPYPQFFHCRTMGQEMAVQRQALGDDSWFENHDTARAYYYICRAGQHFERWIAKWTAAGRARSDLVCLMSGLRFSPNSTLQYIQFADRMDSSGRLPGESGYTGPIPFDRISFAPYLRLYPERTVSAASFDQLTRAQAVDLADAFCDHLATSLYGTSLVQHQALIAGSSRPHIKLSAYEGGPEMMGGYGTNPTRSARNATWNFEPRAVGQMLALLKLYDGQMDVIVKSGLAGIMGVEGDTKCYSAYFGPEQLPGVGDGSDGKLDNRPYLTDPATGLAATQIDLAPGGNLLVSPVGEAVARWNGAGPPAAQPNGARFIRSDTTTRGSWKGTFGTDGFAIAQDPSASNPSWPAYAQVAFSGANNWVWAASTSDARALQKVSSTPDRLAACWYTSTQMDLRITITDGLEHLFAIYMLDWDHQTRTAAVQVMDHQTGDILDARSVRDYQDGVYLVWAVRGDLTVRLVNGGGNAIVNGIFLGASQTPPVGASRRRRKGPLPLARGPRFRGGRR